MTRAVALAGCVACVIAGCNLRPPEPVPESLSIEFLADFNVAASPDGPDRPDGGDRFGGISAVSYDASSDRWIALSDDRVSPRYFELSVVYDGTRVEVETVSVTELVDARGHPFPEDVLDPEGIALSPWETFWISTEPDTRTEPVEQAKLVEFAADGRERRRVPPPEAFIVAGSPPAKGLRHNRGFESLTLSPSGRRLFAGSETSLIQDGPEATFDRPAFCRLVEYQVSDEELELSAEYVYPVGPVASVEGVEVAELDAGLVELVALTDSLLLALERDFIAGPGDDGFRLNRARIFVVDVSEASDVSTVASLQNGGDWTPVRKELVLDFDDIVSRLSAGYQRLDNFEAMGLGPELPGGGRGLLVVSDDNFSDSQRSAFLLFRMKAVVE